MFPFPHMQLLFGAPASCSSRRLSIKDNYLFGDLAQLSLQGIAHSYADCCVGKVHKSSWRFQEDSAPSGDSTDFWEAQWPWSPTHQRTVTWFSQTQLNSLRLLVTVWPPRPGMLRSAGRLNPVAWALMESIAAAINSCRSDWLLHGSSFTLVLEVFAKRKASL